MNVVRPSRPEPLLTRDTLVRVLATPTIDRVVRCLTGSVAVSAYELESLPLPDAGTLRAWNELDETALPLAVARAYGTAAP